ncbi:MAG: class I SAM-dependent methyltransferase [Candidatus Methanoperedens sp.]|nr:class I SAM-dependent methyltransferase [Candidatus Methanoperedens sp.]MCE8425161.1 class I SAM-dependent methyltransferase [Candidatus Methanoperedens sp.]MCE8427568.1 class I SAM-dependent methyltransferase [Candidatus Methanoperedens sp.]
MYIDINTSSCKIFRQIPEGKKVLEIGCGSGRLANLLTLQKKCKVYCIEKDPVMSHIAQGKCVEVLNKDIEKEDPPYSAGFFDCIILGNVLEHFKDPEDVLRRLMKYLSDTGFLIYSVPNIVNWYSRMTILSGKFEYSDSGVFDRAHIRFYDFNSAKKLVLDAGYIITWIDVTPSIYFGKRYLNFLWYDLAFIWKNLFADEFIIIAEKYRAKNTSD